MVASAKPFDVKWSGPAVLEVRDTLAGLWALARWHRAGLDIPFVGVTGTCGKTSTKELIAAALGEGETLGGEAFMSPASFNNRIGVPISLLMIRRRHAIAVLELGSNAPGEIEELAQLARPKIAVITGVGVGHLAGLHDPQGVLIEKLSIVKGLGPGGTLVVNGDDPVLVAEVRARGYRFVSFGLGPMSRFRGEDVDLTPHGTRFRYKGRQVFIRLFGAHAVLNALAALAVAELLGQTRARAIAGLSEVRPVSGRLSPVHAGRMTILDDTYNSNPFSMRAALAVFHRWPVGARRVVILGDMRELGAQSERWHRRMGELCGLIQPDLVVTCGAEARFILEGAGDQGFSSRKMLHFKSTESLLAQISDIVSHDDLVLVKGSRALKMERVVDRLIKSAMAVPHAVSPALSVA